MRAVLGLMVTTSLITTGCWGEPKPCTLWRHKLAEGQEVAVAVGELRRLACPGVAPLLLEHLDDEGVTDDVLGALIALGRGPESEQAVARTLGRASSAAVAAKQVAAWKLEAARDALAVALVDPALVGQRGALLDAAMAVLTPVDRAELLVTWFQDDAAMSDALAGRVVAGLGDVAWSEVKATTRGGLVEGVLARLLRGAAARPDWVAAGVALVAAAAPGAASGWGGLVKAAEAGDVGGLWLLKALGDERWRALSLGNLARERSRLVALGAAALLAGGADPASDAALRETPGRYVPVAVAAVLGRGDRALAAAQAETTKGASRAGWLDALLWVLQGSEVGAWEDNLRGAASVLLRRLPDRPESVSIIGLSRRCGDDAACLIGALHERLDGLGTLDARMAAAVAQTRAAQSEAEDVAGADGARARELANATGEAASAARSELDAIRKRHDAAYANVRQGAVAIDALSATRAEVIFGLSRLVDLGDVPAEPAAELSEALLSRCEGVECAVVRSWSLALVGRHGPADDDTMKGAARRLAADAPLLAIAIALGRGER